MYKSVDDAKVSDVRVIENNYNYKAPMGKPIGPNDKGGHDSKNAKDHCDNKFCVDVESTVLDNCPNTPVTPIGIPGGVVVKIPVVLAELTVRFNIGAFVKLPEPALEVKDIKKRLKITQCTLLQPTNILFIKGFVRKNIDYSTGKCSNREGVCGDIKHCTIDVPFECSTPVTFTTAPAELLVNSVSEFEYFRVSDLPNKFFAEKDSLLSGDLSEINQFRVENFNELPFCELIQARIFEFDEFIGRERPHHDNLPFEEKFFKHIEEKMVIELTLKLLQNRQVRIPSVAGIADPYDNQF